MKKKGFTMAELLAAVVILGIIGTIGIVGVNKIIKSSHKKHNLAQAKLFVSGAQMYFTDNKSKLPTKTFTSKEVTLKKLQEKNYVETLVDYKKKPYNSEKSYVYVTKMGTGRYAYDGELLTQDGERTKYKPERNDNGKVKFYLGTQNFTNQIAYTNSTGQKEIIVNIEDPDTIAGYIITLYKGGKELRELEYKEVGNKTQVETKIKISPKEYPDGQYKIQAKVIDIYNNQKTAKSGTLVVDTIAPQCTTKIKGTEGKNGWYTSDVETMALCTDKDEKGQTNKTSGCNTSKTQLTTGGGVPTTSGKWTVKQDGVYTVTYTVYDKAGNETICDSIEVKRDVTAPTCKIKVTTDPDGWNGWYTINPTIQLTNYQNDDDVSGLEEYGLKSTDLSSKFSMANQKIQDTNTKGVTWSGYVIDKAGNEGSCSLDEIKVDTTPPSWNDQCSNNENCYNGITATRTVYWWNLVDYQNVGGYRMGQYYNTSVSGIHSIKRYKCIDDNNCKELLDTACAVEDNKHFCTEKSTCSSTFTDNYRQTCPYTKDQNEVYGYVVVNNAGKESLMRTIRVKIDKTPPEISGFLFQPAGAGEHSVSCKDTGSGMDQDNSFKYSGKEDVPVDPTTQVNPSFDGSLNIKARWKATGQKQPTFICCDLAGNCQRQRMEQINCYECKMKNGDIKTDERECNVPDNAKEIHCQKSG